MNHSNQPGQPDDDLDRLLSAYLKAQVPDPWPSFRVPQSVPPAPRAAGTPGRYVLAASAAALLGLGLYLSSGVQQPGGARDHATHGTGLLKNATASGKGLMTPAPNR